MSTPKNELAELRQAGGPSGDFLRMVQGRGAAMDALSLVDTIRTDQPVRLVEPARHELTWNDALARRWACDCVEHALPAAAAVVNDESDLWPIEGAIHTAREYLDGEARLGTMDAKFIELFVEEWPTYKGPFAHIVEAARHATARDEGANGYPGIGTIQPGEWAATAARESRRAVKDSEAELRWQAARLLDYLFAV